MAEEFKLLGPDDQEKEQGGGFTPVPEPVVVPEPEPTPEPVPTPLPTPEPVPEPTPEPTLMPEPKPFKPAEPPPPPKKPRRAKKEGPSGGRPSPLLYLLLIAACGYLIYTYWPLIQGYLPMGKPAPTATVTIPVPVTTTTLSTSTEAAASAEAAVTATREVKAVDLVDPFVLRIRVKGVNEVEKVEEKKEPTRVFEPELEGIWIDSSMKVAFISGQALTEGNSIMGFRVKQIQKTQVTLTKGNQVKILKLEGNRK